MTSSLGSETNKLIFKYVKKRLQIKAPEISCFNRKKKRKIANLGVITWFKDSEKVIIKHKW